MDNIQTSKLNRSVEIELGGRIRNLKFTTGALEMAERLLPSKNIFNLIGRNMYSYTELIACIYAALLHEDEMLKLDDVKSWVLGFIRKEGAITLSTYVYTALVMCGLLGDEVAVQFESLANVEKEENATDDEPVGKS